MTTLELQLDDELGAFVERQRQTLGHASGAAYIQSLLALEKLRDRASLVGALLRESSADTIPSELVDEAYWQRLGAEVFHESKP